MSAGASGVLIAGRRGAIPAFHDASSFFVASAASVPGRGASAVGWVIFAYGTFGCVLPFGDCFHCCHALSASPPRAITASILAVPRMASSQRLRYAAIFGSFACLLPPPWPK